MWFYSCRINNKFEDKVKDLGEINIFEESYIEYKKSNKNSNHQSSVKYI